MDVVEEEDTTTADVTNTTLLNLDTTTLPSHTRNIAHRRTAAVLAALPRPAIRRLHISLIGLQIPGKGRRSITLILTRMPRRPLLLPITIQTMQPQLTPQRIIPSSSLPTPLLSSMLLHIKRRLRLTSLRGVVRRHLIITMVDALEAVMIEAPRGTCLRREDTTTTGSRLQVLVTHSHIPPLTTLLSRILMADPHYLPLLPSIKTRTMGSTLVAVVVAEEEGRGMVDAVEAVIMETDRAHRSRPIKMVVQIKIKTKAKRQSLPLLARKRSARQTPSA